MPGSGKSSTGRSLAALLGFTFIDTDEVIVKVIGKTIPDIFASEGEEAFRRYETQALESVAESEGQVVGTGGGIVTQEINWELMRGSGHQPGAGHSERMTEGNCPAIWIDMICVVGNPQLPQYGQALYRERFIEFYDVHLINSEPAALQNFPGRR